jgi:hypothetical protein
MILSRYVLLSCTSYDFYNAYSECLLRGKKLISLLHTRIHVNTNLMITTNERRLGTFKQIIALVCYWGSLDKKSSLTSLFPARFKMLAVCCGSLMLADMCVLYAGSIQGVFESLNGI